MYVTKEKNIVTFTIDNGKNYIFDINSLILYGLQGKPLKTVPTELKHFKAETPVLNYIRRMFCTYKPIEFESCKKALVLADKFSSLGFLKEDFLPYVIDGFASVLNNTLYGVKITEKFLFNFIKNSLNQELKPSVNKLKTVLKYEMLNKLLTVILTEKDKAFFLRFCKDYDYPIENYKLIANWINKGLGIFFNYNSYEVNHCLNSFFQNAEAIGYTPTKDNFFYQAIQVNKNYEIQKEEIEHEKLIENQTKINLNFENEEFVVIVPTTKEEFKNEGDNQKNCVYTHYLNKVLEGMLNVVFIRRKSDIKSSYITCEINNGNIKQYLTTYNRYVRDVQALVFKIQYQNYLDTIFNK